MIQPVVKRYSKFSCAKCENFNPLNPELNPICYLLALLGAHHFLHVSRIRVGGENDEKTFFVVKTLLLLLLL